MNYKTISIREYVDSQIDWSKIVFGEGQRTEGLCKHIEKELDEIRSEPNDILEWVDVIILGIDGAWRAGYTADEIAQALVGKQEINKKRTWVRKPEDQPIEHER